jgi:FkbM family methyltransferase
VRTTALRIRGRLDRARLRRALQPTSSVDVVRLGSDYGGWVVPSDLLDESSIVYSAGVGEDVTFDLALIERTSCHVWAFDPTPRAAAHVRGIGDERFHFLPVGLWSSDGTRRFYGPRDPEAVSYSTVSAGSSETFDAPCTSLQTLMADLGHDRIDLLKLDIEGAEYEVLASLRNVTPACICVELHPLRPLSEMVAAVRRLDYEVVHVEGWNVTLVHSPPATSAARGSAS